MTHEAFLIGIGRYRDHTIDSIANDLALLSLALRRRGYRPSAIHVFNDTHSTLADLHVLLGHIQATFHRVDDGSCYVHIGASGTLALDPVRGGVLPRDGDPDDFGTALPFAALNDYLPARPGVRVTVTIDT
jgi:hypothetical protein